MILPLLLVVLLVTATPVYAGAAFAKPLTIALFEVRGTNDSQIFVNLMKSHLASSCANSLGETRFVVAYPPFKDELLKIAANLIDAKPDVLVATTINNAKALRDHPKRTQPIVFYAAADPVEHGLVQSFANPGHNMTGISSYLPSEPKRLALLKELFPAAKTIGLVYDVEDVPFSHIQQHIELIEKAGLRAIVVPLKNQQQLAEIAGLASRQAIDAFDVSHTSYPSRNSEKVAQTLNATGLPAIYDGTQYVRAGGLLSYEPEEFDVPAVTADLICTALKNGDASRIPVRRPAEFVTAVNLATAQQLGIAIPKWLLKRADVVVGSQARAATDR